MKHTRSFVFCQALLEARRDPQHCLNRAQIGDVIRLNRQCTYTPPIHIALTPQVGRFARRFRRDFGEGVKVDALDTLLAVVAALQIDPKTVLKHEASEMMQMWHSYNAIPLTGGKKIPKKLQSLVSQCHFTKLLPQKENCWNAF